MIVNRKSVEELLTQLIELQKKTLASLQNINATLVELLSATEGTPATGGEISQTK